MNNKCIYYSQAEVKVSGERTIKTDFTYWAICSTDELIEAEITQSLLNGKSITLANNEIYVGVDKSKGEPKLTQLLDVANNILQNDFKMECDDNFGMHRSVIAESVHIYPGDQQSGQETFFEIQFDVVIRLSTFDIDELVTEIQTNGFILLHPILCKNFFRALKLAHDRPNNYMISKIQGKYWIHPYAYENKKLWKYYALQIWSTIDRDSDIIRLAQTTCPDKALRKRLQQISLPNYRILNDYQTDLEENTAKIEAMKKITALNDDKGDLKEKVGLYIVQLIRENPQKYLNSVFPFIKEIAAEIQANS